MSRRLEPESNFMERFSNVKRTHASIAKQNIYDSIELARMLVEKSEKISEHEKSDSMAWLINLQSVAEKMFISDILTETEYDDFMKKTETLADKIVSAPVAPKRHPLEGLKGMFGL
jgi:hypothetical protein